MRNFSESYGATASEACIVSTYAAKPFVVNLNASSISPYGEPFSWTMYCFSINLCINRVNLVAGNRRCFSI